ncbi:MAG: V-type ATP synthase subunit D [Peptococcaceae bacterium]|jgi:V/A-type H+-transporting ATPase subunit D|nr:V-type ATP synthase subunit D [Peptococcaceae bacterium]
MDPNTFPTKGNLILAKNTLKLSRQGYELLDKKRNVLIKEIMELNDQAKALQKKIEQVFQAAYTSLQSANIEMGILNVERVSHAIPVETAVRIGSRGVMGVEIPIIGYENSTAGRPFFGFANSSLALDHAFAKFNAVKDMIIELAALENAAYRLAVSIKKTQKRANALQNVTIPRFEALVKQIQETLEERERDEFTRLKMVKKK